MTSVRNVHTRHLNAPPERVRPWIDELWSGGARDCFPRDVIPSWRRSPAGADPRALLPGATVLGHGPFRFRLRRWDGRTWRADALGGAAGWHGFDLAPEGRGCRLTYTLELDGGLPARLGWLLVAPLHDWAVEALLDRLEHAARTGAVPARTERPLPFPWAAGAALLGLAGRRRSRDRAAALAPRSGSEAP